MSNSASCWLLYVSRTVPTFNCCSWATSVVSYVSAPGYHSSYDVSRILWQCVQHVRAGYQYVGRDL